MRIEGRLERFGIDARRRGAGDRQGKQQKQAVGARHGSPVISNP